MEKIPEKSQAGISTGFWFVWNDGTNTIKGWGSPLSGMERVYLNDQLVSEKRNLKTKSEHNFDDRNNDHYEVSFNVANILKGIECQFKKNGIVQKKITCRYQFGRIFKLKNLVLFLLGFAIIFILGISFNLSESIVFALTLLLCLIILMRNRKNRYAFEEV